MKKKARNQYEAGVVRITVLGSLSPIGVSDRS